MSDILKNTLEYKNLPVTLAAGSIGLTVSNFVLCNQKFKKLEKRLTNLEECFKTFENDLGEVQNHLSSIIDEMDPKNKSLDNTIKDLNKVKEQLKETRKELNKNYNKRHVIHKDEESDISDESDEEIYNPRNKSIKNNIFIQPIKEYQRWTEKDNSYANNTSNKQGNKNIQNRNMQKKNIIQEKNKNVSYNEMDDDDDELDVDFNMNDISAMAD